MCQIISVLIKASRVKAAASLQGSGAALHSEGCPDASEAVTLLESQLKRIAVIAAWGN